jgi:phosphoribosylaminoimidazole-succinocarboxamide synthase
MGYLYPGVYFNRPNNLANLRERIHAVMEKISVAIIEGSVLSRAINFGRQCHFKICLDCQEFKNFPCLIMSMSTKCQKNEKKITINVIQRDDRL